MIHGRILVCLPGFSIQNGETLGWPPLPSKPWVGSHGSAVKEPRPEPSLADLAGAAVPFPTWRKAPTPVRMLKGFNKGGEGKPGYLGKLAKWT